MRRKKGVTPGYSEFLTCRFYFIGWYRKFHQKPRVMDIQYKEEDRKGTISPNDVFNRKAVD